MGPKGENKSAEKPAIQAEEMPPVQEPSEGETPEAAADTQVQPEAQASPEPTPVVEEVKPTDDVLTQIFSLLNAQTQLLLTACNRIDKLEAKIDSLLTKGVSIPVQGKASDGVPLVDANGKCPVCSTITNRKDRKCGSCYVKAMKAEITTQQPANNAA